jgi:hypothetical protein
LADGVTVITAFAVVTPMFEDVNEGMFPEPKAPNPIDESELVQLNVVLFTLPVKFTEVIVPPEQAVELGIALTFGIGFTNTVKLVGDPIQELAEGVTVITPESPLAVLFTEV